MRHPTEIPDPAERVRAYLKNAGCTSPVKHMDETIFTVDDASKATGVPPCQILKSLLFSVDDASIVLILMSGSNKASDKKVRNVLGARKVRMCTAEEIYQFSSFKPGGVPPVGYPSQPMTLMDEDIFKHDVVWAAAGTDHDLFSISPEELGRITSGRKVDLKKN